jgi:hypothetical protein
VECIGYVSLIYATRKYRLVEKDIDAYEVRQRNIMWLSSVVLNVIAVGLAYPNAMASIGIFVIATILAIIYNTVRYRIRVAELVVGATRLKPRGYLNC